MLVAVIAVPFGLVLGSFANVPIHRWPRGGNVLRPSRSACPSCDTEIAARDNVPVFSWLLLRGRCRTCGATIAWRYPAVELLTGLLFALVAAVEGFTWLLPALLAMTWSLVVASVIDLEHRIIPNKLTYRLPFVLLVLLVPPSVWGPGDWSDLLRGLLAAVVVPGGLLALSEGYRLVRGKRGFGLGDVKLLVSLGLVCGYLGWFNVVVLLYGAVITAVVVALVLMALGRARLASRIPFGPYLAIGALLAITAAEALRGPVDAILGI
jgi:leader peptidase (prepilin peptidase)/N-methyltransferase